MGNILYTDFEKMITPAIIKILYIIGLVVAILAGFGLIIEGVNE